MFRRFSPPTPWHCLVSRGSGEGSMTRELAATRRIGFDRRRYFSPCLATKAFPDHRFTSTSNLALIVEFSRTSRLREILQNTVTELSKSRGARGTHSPGYSVRHKVNSGRAPIPESRRSSSAPIVLLRPAARTTATAKVKVRRYADGPVPPTLGPTPVSCQGRAMGSGPGR